MKLLKLFMSGFLLFAISACTLLYIPPVLETQAMPESIDINGSKGLFLDQDELVLSLKLKHIPQEGWLMVQWFSASNEEVASDAQWVDVAQEGLQLNYLLPAQVELGEGSWRAVVSFQNKLVRQFSLDIVKREELP